MFKLPCTTATALAAMMPAPAFAAGPLQVESRVLTEQKTRAPDGTVRVALGAPRRVVPGDRVTFVLAYRNTGAQPLGNVVLDNPVPKGIAYRGPAATSAAPNFRSTARSTGRSRACASRPRPARRAPRRPTMSPTSGGG